MTVSKANTKSVQLWVLMHPGDCWGLLENIPDGLFPIFSPLS